MNLAELLGKVIKRSNQQRNSCTAADGWHPAPTESLFNREWRHTGKKILQPTGGQMHSLDTEKWKGKEVDFGELGEKGLLDEEDVSVGHNELPIPCQAHYGRESVATYMDPNLQRLTYVCTNQSRQSDAVTV